MLKTLLKTQLRYTLGGLFRSKTAQKKRGPGYKILMIVLFVYVAVVLGGMFAGMFYSMAEPFEALDLDWLYYAFAALIAFALGFIGSVFMAQHQLFEAKDNELLLSMPLKPWHILLSRMVSLYLLDFLFTAVVFVPAMGIRVLFVGLGACEAAVSFLGLFLLPLLSVSLSSLLGWLLAAISARMRRKNLISLLLSLVFFGAYFYFCFNIGDYITYLGEHGADMAQTIQRVLFPAYHFGMAAAEGSIVSLVFAAACALVPFVGITLLINRNYVRIMTTKGGSVKIKYKEKTVLRASSLGKTILFKEISRPLATSSILLNTCTGDLLMIIVAVVMVVKMQSLADVAAVYGLDNLSTTGILTVVIAICSALNTLSSSSVSLESRTLWLLKSLPVKEEQLLFAKAGAHFVFSAAGAVLAGLVACIATPVTAREAACIFLLPLSVAAFGALSGVMINLHMPKFNWLSETACVKQSGSVLVSMLVNLAVVVAPLLLYFVCLKTVISAELFLLLAAAFFLVLSAGEALRIRTAGVKLFRAL